MDRKVNSDQWEFSHPNFRRGWFDLLKDIKRRKTASKEDKRSEMSKQHRDDTISNLLSGQGGANDARKIENLLEDKDALIVEVIKLRKQQDATQRMLAATLNELHETRCEQQRIQDTVEKVVSFLSTIVEDQGKVTGRPQVAIEGPQLFETVNGMISDDGDAPVAKRAKKSNPETLSAPTPISDLEALSSLVSSPTAHVVPADSLSMMPV